MGRYSLGSSSSLFGFGSVMILEADGEEDPEPFAGFVTLV